MIPSLHQKIYIFGAIFFTDPDEYLSLSFPVTVSMIRLHLIHYSNVLMLVLLYRTI